MRRCLYVATHSFSASIRVGSHRYAERFSNDYETLYVPHPLTPAGMIKSESRSERSFANALKGPRVIGPNLVETTPLMLAACGNQWPLNTEFVTRMAPHFCWPPLKRVVESSSLEDVELLIIDTCFQSYWVDVVSPQRLVVRIADDPEGFGRGFSRGVKREWEALLERADLVVTVSSCLADKYSGMSRKVLVCQNGVTTDFAARTVPLEVENASGPVAVYVGAVADWLDVRLVAEVAVKLPEWTFVMIGPTSFSVANAPENLKFVGPKPHSEIGNYLLNADVGIAPFDVGNYPVLFSSVDAIKIYEYLACGLQVVATSWPQTEHLGEYLFVSPQNANAFAQNLSAALSNPKNRVSHEVIGSWSWDTRYQQLRQEIALL